MRMAHRILGVTALACSMTSLVLAQRGGAAFRGIMVLDSTATNGPLQMSGSARMKTNIVYVNSSAANGANISGSAVLDTSELDVVGGAKLAGSWSCTGKVVGFPGPALDPFATLSIPAADTANNLGSVSVSGVTRTLSPGYYSGGISVSGGGHVIFNPGVYVVGNGVTISSSSAVGDGVTFVILGGKFTLSGGSTAALTPNMAGPLAGVLLAQPLTNTSNMTLSGGCGISMTGVIWAPVAKVTVSGSSTIAGQGPLMGDMLVAKRVTISGSGMIFVGGATPDPLARPQMQGLYD